MAYEILISYYKKKINSLCKLCTYLKIKFIKFY